MVSNDCGIDDWGLGKLVKTGQIGYFVGSYIGENKTLVRDYLNGKVSVELCPQGTLAERLRAAGAGIPAFYTPTGVGTVVETGDHPSFALRFDGQGGVSIPTKWVSFVRLMVAKDVTCCRRRGVCLGRGGAERRDRRMVRVCNFGLLSIVLVRN